LNAYEGMFVIDPREVGKDLVKGEEVIRNLIGKVGGETAGVLLWDERKMAYDIKGRDTGLYMLVYFTGGLDVIRDLNRECRLSNAELRSLILRIKALPNLETLSTPARPVRMEREQDREREEKTAPPPKPEAEKTEKIGETDEAKGADETPVKEQVDASENVPEEAPEEIPAKNV